MTKFLILIVFRDRHNKLEKNRDSRHYILITTTILLITFFSAHTKLHAINNTKGEIGYALSFEVNRSFYSSSLSTFGEVALNDIFTLKGGFSIGKMGTSSDTRLFAKAETNLPIKVPLQLSLHYIYNEYPEYRTAAHTLLPMISLKYRRAGISAGPAWRFTTFNREQPIIEPIISFSCYINFINSENILFGLAIANITDFHAGNTGSYFPKLYSTFRLSNIAFLTNELIVHQTGSIALAANFYGIAYKVGMSFRW